MSVCEVCGGPMPAPGDDCPACLEKASREAASPVWRRPWDSPSEKGQAAAPGMPPPGPMPTGSLPLDAQAGVVPAGTASSFLSGPSPVRTPPAPASAVPVAGSPQAAASPSAGSRQDRTSLDRRWLIAGAAAVVVAVVLGTGLHEWVGRDGSRSATPTQDGTVGGAEFSAAPPGTDPSTFAGGDPSTTPAGQDDTPSGAAATSEAEQASALDALLDKSASGRSLVGPAVLGLSACDGSTDPSTAASSVEQAMQNRQDLLAALDPVAVDALPNGSALKDLLREAWSESLTADRLYLEWARAIAAGGPCNPSAPSKSSADAASSRASQAKTSFVSAWNSDVAGPLHLVPRQEKDL
jgi:hypothetical protein